MNHDQMIQRTAAHVQAAMSDDTTGHDWWHVYRVWQTARRIGQREGADLFVVELAALLHDLGDHKFHDGDDTVAPRMTREWLGSIQAAPDVIDHVAEIVSNVSFKGAGVPTPMQTLEGQVAQDADRLDAIGAVGIGRAFTWGGHKGRPMHDPTIKPEHHTSFDAYKSNTNPTINHFYEKLLLLKDRMNTESARQIAAARHEFMEQFLEQFLAEWDSRDMPED
jgi:uncharacterized protein